MLNRCCFLLLSIFFVSCGAEEELEDVISKTWDLKWRKCGLYQSSIDAQINFNLTDSINSGWYREGEDTSYFQFEIVNNQTVLLDSVSNNDWSGVLKVSQYSSNLLELERTNKECENELYSFK